MVHPASSSQQRWRPAPRRAARLTPGSYKQVGKWGKSGAANGQFRGPFGIATDKSGDVYVADTDNNRVQVFSASGRVPAEVGLDRERRTGSS